MQSSCGRIDQRQAPTNDSRYTGYTVGWTEGHGLRISRVSDKHDVQTVLLLGTPDISDPPKRWEIEVEGDAIHLRGDGRPIATIRDSVYRQGYLGFWANQGCEIRIDNVVISSPAAKSRDPAGSESFGSESCGSESCGSGPPNGRPQGRD